MRLPHKGAGIDVAQTSEMVERHPRESYTLATKLFAAAVPTEGLAKKKFETSLKHIKITDMLDKCKETF